MKNILLILSMTLIGSWHTHAANYAYFGFEPAIITNYIATKKKIGYVRVSVELMIEEANNLATVEHHSPLLRDAIVNIIGQQTEEKIKSIKGRVEIQRLCEEKVKSLLTKETGKPLIKKLLFTQWLDD